MSRNMQYFTLSWIHCDDQSYPPPLPPQSRKQKINTHKANFDRACALSAALRINKEVHNPASCRGHESSLLLSFYGGLYCM